MGDRWKLGDDPLLKYWGYRRLHEKLTAGAPQRVNQKLAFVYAREIERALKSAPEKVLDTIFEAESPEEIAAAVESLEHDHTGIITECPRCTLLGGWPNHQQILPRMIPPLGDRPARVLQARISNRTVPELLFAAIAELQKTAPNEVILRRTSERLTRIADYVAAPALYDDLCVPLRWLDEPTVVPQINSSHPGTEHYCPSCGGSWPCAAVGCQAEAEHLCSGCRGNSPVIEPRRKPRAKSLTVPSPAVCRNDPLPDATTWKASLAYSREVCRKERVRRKKSKRTR